MRVLTFLVALQVNMSVSATHNGTFITLRTISDRADIKFLTADTQHYIAQSVAELRARGEDDAFIVTDLAQVYNRHKLWTKCFPDVRPFFALKAQNNLPVRCLLTALGCGFDCASLGEIQDVMGCRVQAQDVLYGQPYKQVSHLKESLLLNITSVCDTAHEVAKVGLAATQLGITPRVMIRILPEDGEGVIKGKLSSKFGAPLNTLDDIAEAARDGGVDIVGVGFHVGSHCHSAEPYLATMVLARQWWEELERQDCVLSVLDIGGGFPGEGGEEFIQMAGEINLALRHQFGDIINRIQVIAEPGRYMVTSSQTIVAPVIAVKEQANFVLSTGVYGGLSTSMWDRNAARGSKPYIVAEVDVVKNGAIDHSSENDIANGYKVNESPATNGSHDGVTNKDAQNEDTQNGDTQNEDIGKQNGDTVEEDTGKTELVLWGPTCDSSDRLVPGYTIPGLQYGDWVAFPDLGSYGSMIMTTFNGFQPPVVKFVCSSSEGDAVRQLFK